MLYPLLNKHYLCSSLFISILLMIVVYLKCKEIVFDRSVSIMKKMNWSAFILGIGFTFIIALLGYVLAIISGFNRVGPLASDIILAILYRQFFVYPDHLLVLLFLFLYIVNYMAILNNYELAFNQPENIFYDWLLSSMD